MNFDRVRTVFARRKPPAAKVKLTWPQRLRRWGIRAGIVIGGFAVIIPVGSFLWQSHVADVNISNFEKDRKAGDADTKKQEKLLADPGVRVFLADPFFTTDKDWATFVDKVHAEDTIARVQLQTAMRATVDETVWPVVRDRVNAYAKTMTLSMGTGTRVKLYAANTYLAVCDLRKPHLTDPFYTAGPAGLAQKVTAVAAQYCTGSSR